MISFKYRIGGLLALALVIHTFISFSQASNKNGLPEIYQQEIKTSINLPVAGKNPVARLIRAGNAIAAVSPGRIFLFDKGTWRTEDFRGDWYTGGVAPDGRLWLGGIGSVAILEGRKLIALPEEATRDTVKSLLWTDRNTLLAGTSGGLWQWNDTWQKVPGFEGIPVRELIHGQGEELWAATGGGLFRKSGGRWVNLTYAMMAPGLGRSFWGLATGTLPGDTWFGCQPALVLVSGKGEHQLWSGDNGLPYGPVTTIRTSGEELWLGTPFGAIRKSRDGFHYYAGKRWLDDNHVNDILVVDNNRVWVATPAGISEIRKVPMTLEQKAAYFEKRLNERHLRYGFASECRFLAPDDTTRFTMSTNDNDGLWTAIYLAAECFRFAVTGEKEAKDNAVRSFLAMEKLNTLVPIPGYVARSYVAAGESTGQGGEWHPTADGKWIWKGDTSSDEIVGHMFAYPLFYDLVAGGEMKERVRSLVDRIMTHIVDHHFEMVDLDGKATRWAVWNPDSLNHSVHWMYERGINSLQILAHLKTAAHVTQNPTYEKAYQYLAKEHGYLDNMLYQKMFGPWEINHSDDELSFLPYYTLMRYGGEGPDRKTWSRSLERSWKAEEADRIPIWNYIASIGLGKDCGLKVAREELQQISLDIRNWKMNNSHRWDLVKSTIRDRFLDVQATLPIPTPERAVSKWNTNTYRMDNGGDGLSEDDGAYYLLAYWMARYHKLVK